MAITTIYTVIADVVFMAELNRLLLFKIATRKVRRPCNLRVHEERRPCEQRRRDHGDPSDIVRTLVKKLCHLSISLAPVRKRVAKVRHRGY